MMRRNQREVSFPFPADLQRIRKLRSSSFSGSLFVPLVQYFEFRLNNLKAPAVTVFIDFAVESDNLSGLKLVAEIGGIEPNAF
jgi:hypothetical protein